MADLIESVRLSDRLTEIRDTQRSIAESFHRSGMGEPWPARIRPAMDLLQAAHDNTGTPILTVAKDAARRATDDGQPHLALQFLAAAVELLDPTEAADEEVHSECKAVSTYDVPDSHGGTPR